jgi:hypothetical protein
VPKVEVKRVKSESKFVQYKTWASEPFAVVGSEQSWGCCVVLGLVILQCVKLVLLIHCVH